VPQRCTRVLSVPLPVQELVAGRLNVYLCGVRPEGDSAVALATRFAARPSSRCRTCTCTRVRWGGRTTWPPYWAREASSTRPKAS
jgi:hypothetical protein